MAAWILAQLRMLAVSGGFARFSFCGCLLLRLFVVVFFGLLFDAVRGLDASTPLSQVLHTEAKKV